MVEYCECYMVSSEEGEFDVELLGNLWYVVVLKNDLFVVGDWVVIFEYDEGKVLIYVVFFCYIVLEWQVVGKFGEW